MLKYLFLLLPFGLTAQVQGNFKSRSRASSSSQVQSNVMLSNYNSSQATDYLTFGGIRANIVSDNVVEFNINALGNQKADAYTAIFNIVQLGKTADETNTVVGWNKGIGRE